MTSAKDEKPSKGSFRTLFFSYLIFLLHYCNALCPFVIRNIFFVRTGSSWESMDIKKNAFNTNFNGFHPTLIGHHKPEKIKSVENLLSRQLNYRFFCLIEHVNIHDTVSRLLRSEEACMQ